MNTLEPLCNLEQSELLVGLLFNEPTLYYYSKDGELCKSNIGFAHFNRKKYPLCACPTISMARNWVWEKYKLWIGTTYNPTTQSFYSMAWTDYILPFTKVNKSHIEAESECLTEILKHLKNKAND